MLVDTTVWVDHLRRGDAVVVDLLEHLQVTVHPFVVGELACGHIRNRPAVLAALGRLPAVPVMGMPTCSRLSRPINSWDVGSGGSTLTCWFPPMRQARSC